MHEPTNAGAKGSAEIIKVVNDLRVLGFKIELIIPTRMSTQFELSQYVKQCDLVIDQIYSDSVCGAFAAECGTQGKAVMIAGRALPYLSDLEFVKSAPTISMKTEDLKLNIIRLYKNRNLLMQHGANLKDYIDHNWERKFVASNYRDLFVPSERQGS